MSKTKVEAPAKNIATEFTEDEKFAREQRTHRQMMSDGWALFDCNSMGIFEIEGLSEGKFDSNDMAATKAVIKAAKAGNVPALKTLLFLMAKIAEPVIAAAMKAGQHSCCEGTEAIQVTIPDDVAETAARAVL